jgi:hypothetical protein
MRQKATSKSGNYKVGLTLSTARLSILSVFTRDINHGQPSLVGAEQPPTRKACGDIGTGQKVIGKKGLGSAIVDSAPSLLLPPMQCRVRPHVRHPCLLMLT